MPLKLISNLGRPNLENVGGATIDPIFSKINIVCHPGSVVFIERDGQKIKLLESFDKTAKISGPVKLNDVYIFERGLERLVLTVGSQFENTVVNQNIHIDARPVYELTDQKRKTVFISGVIILILLIVSVVFGVNQKKTRELNEKNTGLLNQAKDEYQLSVSESISKEDARLSFIKSKSIALELKESGYKNSELEDLLSKISEIEADILGEIKTELKEYLDLTLQTSGFEGNKIASSGDEMFILDEKNKNIIRIEIKNKNAKIVLNQPETDGIKSLGSYENRLFIEKDDGIYEVKNNSLIKQLDRDWDNGIFYLYAGNIYLVNKDDNQIYRASGSQGSFSSKSNWLSPGLDLDLSKITRISIDGSIWAISSSGKVTKFTLGNPQSVIMKGISDPLVNPTSIYTNEKLKYVYILESEKGRVLVLEKNGDFKMQYVNDGFNDAKDIVVSEVDSKAVLLTGSKLMFFDIKK